MPVLRTDDSVRHLRAVWLGPPGKRLPFDVSYVALLFGLVVVPLCTLILLVPMTLLLGSMGLFIAGPLGPVVGVAATRRVMHVVDYDRKVRYWRSVVQKEFRQPKAVSEPATVSVVPPYRRCDS